MALRNYANANPNDLRVKEWAEKLQSRPENVRDAIFGRKYKHLPNALPPAEDKKTSRARRGQAGLRDEDVMFMRDYCHRHGRANIAEWVERFNVSDATLSYAIHGKTYADLPNPYTESLFVPGMGRKAILTPDQLSSLYELRKSRPELWSYKKLAERSNRLYGTRYSGANIQRLFRKRFENINRPDVEKKPSVPRARVRARRTPRPKRIKPQVAQQSSVTSVQKDFAARFIDRFKELWNETED